MSIRGKWRIVRMPDYVANFPDMMGPAYILFGKSGGEFAFGCVTGAIHGPAKGDAVEFTWSDDDEMEEACGDGWAKLRPDGNLEGQISFQGGVKPASSQSLGVLLQQPANVIGDSRWIKCGRP